MRIDARYPAGFVASAGQATPPAGGRFALGASTARDTARAGAAAPLATLDAILMLQEEDPRERKRRQAERGRDLLDGLDRLKAGLLSGAVPLAEIETLARRLEGETSGDPALDETLGAIELRVKVELAKLGRA
jgi:hypothetical protein